MAKRRMAVIAFFACFCIWLTPYYAMAASTSDASKPINIEKSCSLNLTYVCDEIAFKDVPVKLYKVASVSEDFQYTLTERFASSNLILNGIKTNGEWNTICSTLEALIIADNIEDDGAAITDLNGETCFLSLSPGLYIVLSQTITQEGVTCFFDSALIALPGRGEDGIWQYDIEVASKSEIIPPSVNDIELKVIKLWKGDEGKNNRPKNVEVQIFRDGIIYKEIILSKENNWSYSWVVKDDGAKWTVIERNIPSDYTMTAEKREATFIVTNTYTPKNPGKPPQTGETFNVMLFVLIMIVSGSILTILGVIGKRKAYEETK